MISASGWSAYPSTPTACGPTRWNERSKTSRAKARRPASSIPKRRIRTPPARRFRARGGSEILALAKRFGVILVEDNCYGDVNYETLEAAGVLRARRLRAADLHLFAVEDPRARRAARLLHGAAETVPACAESPARCRQQHVGCVDRRGVSEQRRMGALRRAERDVQAQARSVVRHTRCTFGGQLPLV